MGSILVLHEHTTARDRIRRAAAIAGAGGADHSVRFVAEWEELHTSVGPSNAAVVIVDVYHRGVWAVDSIRATVRGARGRAVVAYSDFADRPAREVLKLADAGIQYVLTVDVDDHPSQIRDVVTSAACGTAKGLLFEGLGASSSEWVLELVREAWRLADRHTVAVEDLAVALGIHRRQLERQCVEASILTPFQVLSWCRMVRISMLLADRRRTTDDVAEAFGFTDSSTLRRFIRRMTGRNGSALRGEVGPVEIVEMFVTRMKGDVESRDVALRGKA